MRRRCFLLSASLALVTAGCDQPKKTPAVQIVAPAKPTVAYVEPQPVAAAAFPDVVAELEGSATTAVMPPSGGFIVRQLYGEGTFVTKGDVLFEVDPRLTHSAADVTPGHVVPISIRSPADGVAERAVAGPGDLVTSQFVLTRIATIDPIKAVFDVPADYAAGSGAKEQVEMVQANGTETGSKADLMLDRTTGKGPVKLTAASALFPNPGHTFLPGQYVKIRDLPTSAARSFRVPGSCVVTRNGSDGVLVIGRGDKIEHRGVTVDARPAGACLISAGVQAGDRVVLDGTMPFQDGESVTPEMELSR